MVGTEVILSAVRREIHRAMQKPHKPSRVGLVSSYDPKQHAVKVQLQPEGTQTGWIPSRLAISRKPMKKGALSRARFGTGTINLPRKQLRRFRVGL
jgi:hypothetical protein